MADWIGGADAGDAADFVVAIRRGGSGCRSDRRRGRCGSSASWGRAPLAVGVTGGCGGCGGVLHGSGRARRPLRARPHACRAEIWRQTLPIIRDFPATGTGIGTYERAMLVYQEGNRQFTFNQAHNQYLQLAAEGGLLVGVPALVAAVAFVALATRRIRRDRSAAFWIRVGAVGALTGVATQGIWETGLRMPANAVLCGLIAAIAVHEPRVSSASSLESREELD